MTTKLNSLAFLALLLATLLAGCATKSGVKVEPAVKGNQGKSIPGSVLVIGNVLHPVIPWTEGLTMSKALTQAGYRNSGRNVRIGVVRKGQETLYMEYSQLLDGQDIVLESGDRIEIPQ